MVPGRLFGPAVRSTGGATRRCSVLVSAERLFADD